MKAEPVPVFSCATPQIQPDGESTPNPVYPGAPEQPSVPFCERESDLAKARIKKWLALADATFEKQDHAEAEAQSTRGKRKKSA